MQTPRPSIQTKAAAISTARALVETLAALILTARASIIRGVVGWVDLCLPDVARELESFAEHPKFVGVRHVVQDEPDDRFMLREDFQRLWEYKSAAWAGKFLDEWTGRVMRSRLAPATVSVQKDHS